MEQVIRSPDVTASTLPKDPRNGVVLPAAQPNHDLRTARPLQGVAAALKTIERFKKGEIRNEVSIRY